jgi:hypothetical protein
LQIANAQHGMKKTHLFILKMANRFKILF